MCQGDMTEVVSLRPLKKSDSKLLYEWVSDRDLQVLSAPYWPVSELDHEVWIDKTLRKQDNAVVFAIHYSDQTVGLCKLVGIDWVSRSAELQIRIGNRIFQGRGIGTTAVNLLCRHGFVDLGLHRIKLQVWETNELAKRAYEKAGFKIEGILRDAAYVDGEFKNVVLMSRLVFD